MYKKVGSIQKDVKDTVFVLFVDEEVEKGDSIDEDNSRVIMMKQSDLEDLKLKIELFLGENK